MGRADSKPQEGDSSLLLADQVAGGARAQRCARDSRVGGTQGQVHGVDRGAMESETCCANFLEVPANEPFDPAESLVACRHCPDCWLRGSLYTLVLVRVIGGVSS